MGKPASAEVKGTSKVGADGKGAPRVTKNEHCDTMELLKTCMSIKSETLKIPLVLLEARETSCHLKTCVLLSKI